MDGTKRLNRLARHEERVVALWESLVEALGIHTAKVLLMRVISQTAQYHPDPALIHCGDAGLGFGAPRLTPRYKPYGHLTVSRGPVADITPTRGAATVQTWSQSIAASPRPFDASA
jgi:hypothetical protein